MADVGRAGSTRCGVSSWRDGAAHSPFIGRMIMRVGIQLPEVEREVRWPEYLAMAKAAEEVGFDSIWLGDHLLYDGPERAPWEAWTLMSALAAAT